MNKAKQFIESSKDNTLDMTAPFTKDQINMMKEWAKQLDVELKDVPMLLVHRALIDIQETYIKQKVQENTVKN